MSDQGGPIARQRSNDSEVSAFLRKAAEVAPVRAGVPTRSGERGRLMFALDATASRQPSWDRACRIQSEMFDVAASLGGLDVQLVFYRGYDECKASAWLGDAAGLGRKMQAVQCLAGETQIGRILGHCVKQARERRVNALVFVGDHVEENIDVLAGRAGDLAVLGVPVFVFHEGNDLIARQAFETIAKLTGGACCPFDPNSVDQLRALLGAVAAFAAGGRSALMAYGRNRGGDVVRQLTARLPGGAAD